jgi:hypothetical protein
MIEWPPEELAISTVERLIESTRPGFPGCCVGADDEPELEEPLVANLQEQVGAEVIMLKTLRTGLQPRRSKSLATLCSPAIAACSLRDALMLTGNLTDHDASRRQAAPRCGSPSPMPS